MPPKDNANYPPSMNTGIGGVLNIPLDQITFRPHIEHVFVAPLLNNAQIVADDVENVGGPPVTYDLPTGAYILLQVSTLPMPPSNMVEAGQRNGTINRKP